MMFFACALALAALQPAAASGRTAEFEAVREDFALILREAGLKSTDVTLRREKFSGARHEIAVECRNSSVVLTVRASESEWGSAAYYGLEKLGFLFPHPRRQISPAASSLRRMCGRRFVWKPRLHYRGFHLHTQHPSEWVEGFLGGRPRIAEDTVRWLARNRQNVLQVVGLKTIPDIGARLSPPFNLARRLGITVGLAVSFASLQQKSLRLLDVPALLVPLASKFPVWSARRVAARAAALADIIPFDYLAAELGTSEFTATPQKTTLAWIEAVRLALTERHKDLFIKVHVSSNQEDSAVRNFNFLPRLSDPTVGVLPHTVMFYGLEGKAPVYGRSDFSDMKDFLLAENSRRPTWYFPETSYFIGIDIDIPLFLTDYLVARAQDMELLEREEIQGQVTFSTGQELGYWLMDWTTALLAGGHSTPLAGLDLLGEDRRVWQPVLGFQTRFFKDQSLISVLSSANLLDELPFMARSHQLLKRRILRDLAADAPALAAEAAALERAAQAIPPVSGVKDEELRLMLEITFARVRHALALRRALARPCGSQQRESFVQEARAIRLAAAGKADVVSARYSRYPEAGVFERRATLTSYAYGYGWPAKVLHFWQREEGIVSGCRRNPFYRNIYKPLALLF